MKLSALLFSIATYASTASGQRGGNMMRGSIAATFAETDSLFENLVQSSNTPPPYPNGNDMTPQEYCPHLGSDFPPEDGCYPGGGQNIIGYPSCCAKHERGSGSCPKGHRPRCEKKMADAPSYCADLKPDFTCYVQGWPRCCMTDGTTCPISYVPACDVRSYDPPTKKSRKKSSKSSSKSSSSKMSSKSSFKSSSKSSSQKSRKKPTKKPTTTKKPTKRSVTTKKPTKKPTKPKPTNMQMLLE